MEWSIAAAYERIFGEWVLCTLDSSGTFTCQEKMEGDYQDVILTAQQESDIKDIWTTYVETTVPAIIPDFYPKVLQGLIADRPAPGQPGGEERFYIATDEPAWYRDTGPSWELMFGADALPTDSSQRRLGVGAQQGAAGDHTH